MKLTWALKFIVGKYETTNKFIKFCYLSKNKIDISVL